MSRSIFILAGESSGDLHGAHLAQALRERCPDAALAGMGGPAMRAAGVDVLCDVTEHAAVGISEAISSFRAVLRAYRFMARQLDSQRPDAVVLIDYPEFNLRFARKAHERGIPVAYYILPQIWAWRQSRVRTVARYVDLPLVVLPFEPAFYAKHGVDARFVGHPLVDALAGHRRDKRFAEKLGLPADGFVLGVLPGSRRKEVAALLPAMLGAAERIDRELGGIHVAVAPAPSFAPEQCDTWRGLTSLPIHMFPGRAHDVMAASDLLLIASGTATLEAAIIGTPMIVTYKVSPSSWLLANLLVKVRWASLVNLVAGREIVPELLQRAAAAESLAAKAIAMVRNDELSRVAQDLTEDVWPRLGKPGAADRAAEAILELAGRPA